MGPVRQNPIQRTVSLFICVCIALCTIVAHNIAQNRPDNRLTLQTITTARMMSIWGKGGRGQFRGQATDLCPCTIYWCEVCKCEACTHVKSINCCQWCTPASKYTTNDTELDTGSRVSLETVDKFRSYGDKLTHVQSSQGNSLRKNSWRSVRALFCTAHFWPNPENPMLYNAFQSTPETRHPQNCPCT